ncbi:MAG: ABC transporter permease [Ruminococcus sp.]|nr:ABC transporter permease [Ruminococcus sp.]
MNDTSFFTQTHVYFKKVFRISLREKAWKFLIFAAIIASIVALIVGPDMFTKFEPTNSGFFTLASACIWIGIFNSIQSICKEHEIVRAEYRQGMKMSAYVAAHVLWQALLCLAQAIIIFVLCCIFMHFDQSPHLLISAYVENFVTIYLLTFGAAVLGLMISSISGTPTTAMTIMPFVLIVQLVLSGVLFTLKGATEGFSFVTLSKWGMAAFGCEADLNAIPTGVQKSISAIPEAKGIVISNPLQSDFYKPQVINLLTAWGAILGITVFNAVVSVVALKIKNKDS